VNSLLLKDALSPLSSMYGDSMHCELSVQSPRASGTQVYALNSPFVHSQYVVGAHGAKLGTAMYVPSSQADPAQTTSSGGKSVITVPAGYKLPA
jgi:hypothetical protein